MDKRPTYGGSDEKETLTVYLLLQTRSYKSLAQSATCH